MSLTASAARTADRVAKRFGYRVFPDWALHSRQIDEIDSLDKSEAPPTVRGEGSDYLRRDNPRLLELRKLYESLDEALRTPLVWTEAYASQSNLTLFRGDSNWVYQQSSPQRVRSSLLAAYYILSNDRLGLMDKLSEDGAFGAITFEAAGRKVSRDLLDSILEIDFLDRHLHIGSRSGFAILDIGAGYGRLAHRVLTAFPALANYLCTDAVPESSFVCEYYLRFRGLGNRFKLVPPTEIKQAFQSTKVELAINIHSFSECKLNAVKWWLDRIASHGVRYFLIIPNGNDHGGQLLQNNIGEDMLPIIERSGYRLLVREPKYADPEVQKFAQSPTCFWLFERDSDVV